MYAVVFINTIRIFLYQYMLLHIFSLLFANVWTLFFFLYETFFIYIETLVAIRGTRCEIYSDTDIKTIVVLY